MTIDEPTTVLTDALLGLLCAALGGHLLLHGRAPGRRPAALWGGALLALAVAAASGAVWHGFARAWPEAAGAALWRTTLLSTGAAGFLFVAATLRAALPPGLARRGLALAGAFYAAWLLCIAFDDAFLWAIVAYAPALVLAFFLLGLRGHPWIAAGVAVTVAGSAVQIAGLAPHPRFNHNDLYHVIQMGAVVLFHRGGLRLLDHDDALVKRPPM